MNLQIDDEESILQNQNSLSKPETNALQVSNLLEDEHIKIVEGGNKYLYLEGIRGFGAYAVYNSHFSGEFYDTFFNRDQNATVSSWYLRVIFASPINILLNGSFWVGPFFLLSGLVITISWYKNRRQSSIMGGIFKRYIRLLLPVLSVLSLFYLVGNIGIAKYPYFQEEKSLSFQQFLINVILMVWVGYNKIDSVVWTMQSELFGSYMVYLLALVCVNYKYRWFYYFIIIIIGIKYYDKNPDHLKNFVPLFVLGAAFADLEAQNFFERLRNCHRIIRYLIYLPLIILFLAYATVLPEYVCEIRIKEDCDFFINQVTFNYKIPFQWAQEIGSISIFLLALISTNLQKLLSTRPFVFLGRISFSFYLIHKIITQWLIKDNMNYIVIHLNLSKENAVILLYFIYTPLLMLISHYLEIYIDKPSKIFSQNLETYLRIDKNQNSIKNNSVNPDTKNEIQYQQNLWQFIKKQQIIKTLFIQLGLTYIITEAYRQYKC